MKTLPAGWMPRATAGVRVAASLGRAAARRVTGSSVADDRALGEALVAELDRLKGLSMKVGQILSTLDVGLPEGTAEVLARLQRGARPLDVEVIHAQIAKGLGAPVEALFESFDPIPVASASIGQVHRARLDGEEVAVKIRYPGIREALEADVRNIGRVAALASLATAVDGRALAAELHARLVEECDFRREAAWLGAMGGLLAEDPEVDVPVVVASRSCECVLTTGWVDRAPFEVLRDAPLAEREQAGAALLRFTWRSMYAHGFLHADPHPGNFLFGAAARGPAVTVLDWGSVRRFTPAEIEPLRRLVRVIVDEDRAAFRDALVASGAVPDPSRYDFDAAWEMFGWMWAPYRVDRFTFTTEWGRQGARFSGPGAPNQRRQAFPPAWVWLYRVAFGFHATLTRLGVTLAARPLLEEALARPLVPVPDPCAALVG